MEVKKLERGQRFTMAGHEWIVLEYDFIKNSVLVVAADSIGDMPFDENNSNDFRNSSLRQYLNGEFLEDLSDDIDIDNILFTDFDLTRTNGDTDYGHCRDRVGLLTVDQYQEFKDLLVIDDWWWLISPHSGYSNHVRYVRTDGSLNINFAYYGYFGVRPALCLEGSTEVETDKLLVQELADYSSEELLNELLRRL